MFGGVVGVGIIIGEEKMQSTSASIKNKVCSRPKGNVGREGRAKGQAIAWNDYQFSLFFLQISSKSELFQLFLGRKDAKYESDFEGQISSKRWTPRRRKSRISMVFLFCKRGRHGKKLYF